MSAQITQLPNYKITQCLHRSAGKRQQRDVAGHFDGAREPPLVRSADPGQAARDDLATLGNELREQAHVLVVDVLDFLDAELANLLAAEILAAAFAGATRPATRARAPGRWTLAMTLGCCRRFGRRSRCFRFVSHDAPSLCGADAVVRRLRFHIDHAFV